jgi:hypothetical protein
VHSSLPSRCLLLFVDGLGIPSGTDSMVRAEVCPTLDRLLRTACTPLDARLDTPGVPQSATGQTAIFTGVNAAREVGGHKEGFPDARLRKIITRDNLFKRVLAAGKRCLFANAYLRMPVERIPLPFRSVTTVMTYDALGKTQTREDLLRGLAVHHDLIRESLPKRGIHDIPEISEKEAAGHLLAAGRTVDLCLFEFFLTDHVGHRGTEDDARAILQRLDRFLAALVQGLDSGNELLLIVSDHGNIESSESRHHTCNPVPWIAVGHGSQQALAGMTSLLDVTPRILQLLDIVDA